MAELEKVVYFASTLVRKVFENRDLVRKVCLEELFLNRDLVRKVCYEEKIKLIKQEKI